MNTSPLMLRSLRLLAVLTMAVLTLSACDSEDAQDIAEVEGTFTLTTYTFTPSIGALGTINVRSRLSSPRLVISSGNNEFTMLYGIQGRTGTFSIGGSVSSSGASAIRLNFDDGDRSDREDILLPDQFTLNVVSASELSNASISVSGVDLESYDPQQYNDLDNVSGTMSITLNKTAN